MENLGTLIHLKKNNSFGRLGKLRVWRNVRDEGSCPWDGGTSLRQSPWAGRSPCSNSVWWTANEKKCKDSCLIQQGMKALYNSHWLFKNVLFWINYGLTRSFKKNVQRGPTFPCPVFPNVRIDIRWYIITTRKLVLAECNELDNRPYLDLISLTCTIF